jgi:hypothetical protein
MSDLSTVLAETNTLDDAIIVKGKQEKKHILDAYEERFGQDFDHSIVSKKKDVPRADSLLFLPDSARANLADMGHHVDQEMANSQRGTDLETEATRQSHYIKWRRIIGIPDPCGPRKGYQRIMVIYMKYLQSGINYSNKNNLQSATLHGYETAVNMLFELRNYRPRIDFNDEKIWLGSSLATLS